MLEKYEKPYPLKLNRFYNGDIFVTCKRIGDITTPEVKFIIFSVYRMKSSLYKGIKTICHLIIRMV